jgi:hypothetical protein
MHDFFGHVALACDDFQLLNKVLETLLAITYLRYPRRHLRYAVRKKRQSHTSPDHIDNLLTLSLSHNIPIHNRCQILDRVVIRSDIEVHGALGYQIHPIHPGIAAELVKSRG